MDLYLWFFLTPGWQPFMIPTMILGVPPSPALLSRTWNWLLVHQPCASLYCSYHHLRLLGYQQAPLSASCLLLAHLSGFLLPLALASIILHFFSSHLIPSNGFLLLFKFASCSHQETQSGYPACLFWTWILQYVRSWCISLILDRTGDPQPQN